MNNHLIYKIDIFLHQIVFCYSFKNSNNDSGGYIDTIIDKSDVEFSGRFFLGLCGEAQVIEPLEMKNYIRSFAKKILNQYE